MVTGNKVLRLTISLENSHILTGGKKIQWDQINSWWKICIWLLELYLSVVICGGNLAIRICI